MARGLKGIKKPHPLGSVPTRSGVAQLSVVATASSATASGTGVKISELPAADAANDSDQLEVNQDGTSRRLTVAQVAGVSSLFIQDGTGAVERTVQDRLKETVSVLDFGGVMGGPAAANTTALQAAVATGKVVHIPNGTYTINPTTFATSVRLVGEGETSILQWAPGVNAIELIRISGAGSRLDLRDLVLDSSQASFVNDATYRYGIRFAPTASGVSGARLSAHNVWFINGRDFDVSVVGSITTGAWVKAEFIGCRFSDGLESTATKNSGCIGCDEDVDLLVSGCTFDGPVADGFARVGIRYQQSSSAVQQQGSVVVSGNTFRGMGCNAANGIGSIEIYSGAAQVSVSGNRIIDPRSRGISVKAGAADIAISGNVVKGLTGASAASCIVVFPSTVSGSVGKRCTITGNTCQADVGRGIMVDGSDAIAAPTTPAYEDVVISGNAVMAATDGIFFRYCNGVKVIGNTVRGCTNGIISQASNGQTITIESNDIRTSSVVAISLGAVAAADIAVLNNYIQGTTSHGIAISAANSFQIKGNTIKDGGGAAVSVSAAPTKVSVVQGNTCVDNSFPYTLPSSTLVLEFANVWEPQTGFGGRLITIASDVITVISEMHYVATEGGAATDNVVTINGGRQAQIVTFYASDGTHDVVFKDGGGNLVLASDCTLDTTSDSITLQKNGTNWFELARSNNA